MVDVTAARSFTSRVTALADEVAGIAARIDEQDAPLRLARLQRDFAAPEIRDDLLRAVRIDDVDTNMVLLRSANELRTGATAGAAAAFRALRHPDQPDAAAAAVLLEHAELSLRRAGLEMDRHAQVALEMLA